MEAREVIVRPIVTEKTMAQQSAFNQVTFVVKKGTNKIQIAKAIEEIYKVKVVKVNVVVTPKRQRRVGRFVGKVNGYRKAIVTLAAGDSITIIQ